MKIRDIKYIIRTLFFSFSMLITTNSYGQTKGKDDYQEEYQKIIAGTWIEDNSPEHKIVFKNGKNYDYYQDKLMAIADYIIIEGDDNGENFLIRLSNISIEGTKGYLNYVIISLEGNNLEISIAGRGGLPATFTKQVPSKEEESVSQKKFPFLELGPLKKFQTAEEAYNAGYNDCKQGNAYGTSLRNKQYEMDYDYGWGKAGCPVR